MAVLAGELEMIRRAFTAEHDAIETVMVVKLIQNFKSKSVAVEARNGIQVVRRPRHSKMCLSQIYIHQFLRGGYWNQVVDGPRCRNGPVSDDRPRLPQVRCRSR